MGSRPSASGRWCVGVVIVGLAACDRGSGASTPSVPVVTNRAPRAFIGPELVETNAAYPTAVLEGDRAALVVRFVDPDGDLLALTNTCDTVDFLVCTADGERVTVALAPPAGRGAAQAAVTLSADDRRGGTVVVQLAVEVLDRNYPPAGVIDREPPYVIRELEPWEATVTFVDVDADPLAISFVGCANLAWLTCTDHDDGTVTLRVDAGAEVGFTATTVIVTAEDGAGGGAAVTVPLEILDAAPPSSWYFDAARGDDAADGRRPDAPWRTLANLATITVHGGSRLRLRRGEVWRESLWLRAANTDTTDPRPIIIDTYGEGAAPVLEQSSPLVASWALLGTPTMNGAPVSALTGLPIYVADVTGPVVQLFVDGVRLPQARGPNEGYFGITTAAPAGQEKSVFALSQPQLAAHGVGGSTYAYLRREHWWIAKHRVNGYAGDLVGIDAPPNDPLWAAAVVAVPVGYGVFFVNYLPFLDAPGEWVHDDGKLYVYLPDGSDPSTHLVEVSARNHGVQANFAGAVEINGVAVRRSVLTGISVTTPGAASAVYGCTVTDANAGGIYASGGVIDVSRNTVERTNGVGISVYNTSDTLVASNTVRDVGQLSTQAQAGFSSLGGISVGSSATVMIRDNILGNIGSNAISIGKIASELRVWFNVIDGYCRVVNDCGGIYVNGQEMTTSTAGISLNLIYGGIPDLAGTPASHATRLLASGIYLDWHASDFGVWANTVHDARSLAGAIYVHDGSNNRVIDNVVFQPRVYPALGFVKHEPDSAMTGNSVAGNVLFTPSAPPIRYATTPYPVPPVSETNTTVVAVTTVGPDNPRLLVNPTHQTVDVATPEPGLCLPNGDAAEGAVSLAQFRSTILATCE